uniref:Malonyl-CoA:ACP transacylase (MAT) domain-containing protein n=1 Tax=Varanus komodoensis TaxID=61221 RepID=A0A8D2Q8I8_VARKO
MTLSILVITPQNRHRKNSTKYGVLSPAVQSIKMEDLALQTLDHLSKGRKSCCLAFIHFVLTHPLCSILKYMAQSDFKGICKNLLRSEPVFRNKCNEIKQLFQQISPSGIWELTEKEHVDLSNPEIAQPLLFTVQVALVTLLQYWGIKPIAAVGHSVGEAAAAHCAGLLSLEDAVKVVHHRSRLQAKVSGGKMLVVGNIPVEEVSAALSAYSGKVCVAAFNSPQSCTLSGDEESISAAQKHLAENFKKRNIFLHLLNVPVAYHSHMMDPILTEMAESISVLKKGKLIMDLISTATGKAALGDDFVTGFYWAKQAQDPVSFAEAIMTSAKDKGNIAFVVIGGVYLLLAKTMFMNPWHSLSSTAVPLLGS